jgi:ketosteroid isomerase-like protein
MCSAGWDRARAPALLLALALLAGPAAAHADSPPTPPGPPDEAAVRALVARWLDAQNKGDFAAYRALYAPSFHGIRRSGGRTVVLDHDGWLRDRERMFKKPMKVTAADVRVTPAGALARAAFVQEFSSGTYADRGRKEIDVAVIGGAPAIAREELLESTPLSAKRKPGAPDEPQCPLAKGQPFTGTFRGEPGWFVIGETSADSAAITARARKLEAAGTEAHAIATDMFQGLKQGLFAIVHGAFPSREEAQARVESLQAQKIQAYARESGPLRFGRRLVEIRGVAARNGTPGPWPLQIGVDDGGEGQLTPAANGQFALWVDTVGLLRIENLAAVPKEHDMRAPAEVCIRLAASTRGRVDVGTLDTTTWLCGR